MKKAFTLIELLVVIAIIAVLAAILFPVFAQAKLAAKKTLALSNIKQIATAVQIYIADSDDLYPLAAHNGDPVRGWNWDRFIPVPASQLVAPTDPSWKIEGANTFVLNSIQPFLKNVKMLQCPSGEIVRLPAYYAPSTQPNGLVAPTYTYNGLLQSYSSSSVASPSTVPLFWHGQGKRSLYGYGYASPWLYCHSQNSPCVYVPSTGTGCRIGDGGQGGYNQFTADLGSGNFNGSLLMVAADTSVRTIKQDLGANTVSSRTDPRRDPFARYGPKGIPCGRYWSRAGAEACHPYLFRPDWDGESNDPAFYFVGNTSTQCP